MSSRGGSPWLDTLEQYSRVRRAFRWGIARLLIWQLAIVRSFGRPAIALGNDHHHLLALSLSILIVGDAAMEAMYQFTLRDGTLGQSLGASAEHHPTAKS